MKTTLELAKKCGASRLFSKDIEQFALMGNENLEAFRRAVEADFVSRCKVQVIRQEINGVWVKLYTLPQGETE